ncbi:uncharacterized protein BDR25DRAFT_239596 [Lindgomyces ingoldianus]|uniref:Uncharacterized protein n=1 Tax=Lindgomyces ingoldianus TaxID=673940 RepID=A0ACB6QHE6_9PLEO|nr:uncharacterized protein BDR25DRAFT_239596 [Lindgomyces ingoldianus]KAF2465532.1 hypothetical protein BDR25DRAFT_239596 [Lindgomyces ingoldianus]
MARTREPPSDKNEIQQFRDKVEGDKKDLKTLLQKGMNQAQRERDRRINDIASAISEALLPASVNDQGVNQPQTTFPGTEIAGNPIFASAAQMLEASRGLVKEYDRMEERAAKAFPRKEQHMTEVWQQDVRNTERQLDLGYKIALRNVKKVLGVEGAKDEMKGAEEDREDMEGEEEMSEPPLNYELRKALRYAERGVKRMVKGLPKDEAMDI